MKITLITGRFYPEHTTIGMIVCSIGKRLKELGHEVSIITTTREKQDAGEGEYEGLKVFRIYTKYNERYRAHRSLYNPQTIPSLRRILKRLKPDVVHCHNISYYISYYVLKIAKASGAKVFLTAHDCMMFHYGKFGEFINPNDLSVPEKFDYKISTWTLVRKFRFRYNPFRNLFIKFYLRYVDKIFSVSAALKDAILQNGIVRDIEVLHNGIQSDDWSLEESHLKSFVDKFNLDKKKIVLFGGRLSPGKGGRQAILAMAEVIKTVPNASLMIVGTKNDFSEEMIALARELEIESHLIFTGWLSGKERVAAYHASQLVVVPSVCLDVFPTINLEAMACHRPVIATCFGGSREIVLDGKTGYIVNPYNIKSMADKIIYLLTNPQVSKEFGEEGYRRVQKYFTLEEHIQKLVRRYSAQ